MKSKVSILTLAILLVTGGLLGGCSSPENKEEKQEQTKQQNENVNNTEEAQEDGEKELATVYADAVNELAKAKEGKEVDYNLVIDTYQTELQEIVKKRDEEYSQNVDQQISTALEAGKNGELDGVVVKQIFDKLMQKVFFFTIRHEFVEVSENWENKELVNEEVEEAKEFYEILKSTVEKRDDAYSTDLVGKIDAGFSEIEKAIEADDALQFQLGKQMVDKSLMKTFYLASGAVPNGYATKAAKEAKEDENKAKVEQTEGWAFYQSLHNYLVNNAPEEAEYISKQFDLATDVKELNPEAVNKAFINGFAKVALHEYEESQENWGKDKSVITALEGALFIDMIDLDIKRILGEDAYATLSENAQNYFEAVKAQDKEKADTLLEEIEASVKVLMEKVQ